MSPSLKLWRFVRLPDTIRVGRLMVWSLYLVCLALLLIAPSAHAQTQATIFGTVTDPSGAAVPNETIAVATLKAKAKRQTAADGDGSNVVPVRTDAFNTFNIVVNRRLSPFDIPPSSVASLSWQLLRLSNGEYLLKSLNEGWQTKGILSYRRGPVHGQIQRGQFAERSRNGLRRAREQSVHRPIFEGLSGGGIFQYKAHKVIAAGIFGDNEQNSLIGLGSRLPRFV